MQDLNNLKYVIANYICSNVIKAASRNPWRYVLHGILMATEKRTPTVLGEERERESKVCVPRLTRHGQLPFVLTLEILVNLRN